MKLKIKDLYDITRGIAIVSDKQLSTNTSWKLARNHKKLEEEIDPVNKANNQLIDKYKESDLSDGKVQLKKDKIQDYNQEYEELMQQEVEVDLTKIKLNELGDKVETKALILLEKIIDDAE